MILTWTLECNSTSLTCTLELTFKNSFLDVEVKIWCQWESWQPRSSKIHFSKGQSFKQHFFFSFFKELIFQKKIKNIFLAKSRHTYWIHLQNLLNILRIQQKYILCACCLYVSYPWYFLISVDEYKVETLKGSFLVQYIFWFFHILLTASCLQLIWLNFLTLAPLSCSKQILISHTWKKVRIKWKYIQNTSKIHS